MKYNPDIHHRRSIRLKGYDYSQNGLYFITICTQNREHLFGTITNGQMALNPMGEIAHNEWFKTASMRPNIRLHEFIVMPNHIHGIIEIIPTPPHPVRTHCMRPPDMPNHGQSERLGRVQRAPTNAATTDNHGQSAPGHGQRAGDIVRTHCMRPPDMPSTTDNHGQSAPGHGQHAGDIVRTHCMRPPDMSSTTDNHGQSAPGHGQHAGDIVRAHCMRPPDMPSTTDNHGQRAPTVGDIVRGYKSAVTKRINEIRNISGVPVWQRNYHEHIIRNEIAYLRISEYIQANPRRWQDDNYHD
jgi:REP element-mobilizing transposase RayT